MQSIHQHNSYEQKELISTSKHNTRKNILQTVDFVTFPRIMFQKQISRLHFFTSFTSYIAYCIRTFRPTDGRVGTRTASVQVFRRATLLAAKHDPPPPGATPPTNNGQQFLRCLTSQEIR